MKGCDQVRDFLDKISVVANTTNQTNRNRDADDLLGQWNRKIHPLQNSLKYADEHFKKKCGQGTWSDCGMALYDDIAEMLSALSVNAPANWKQVYDRKEQKVSKQLADLHSRVKTARKKASSFLWLFRR